MSGIRFRVDGDPPSLNASYRIVRIPHPDGKSHQQLAKTRAASDYQTMVAYLARSASRGWQPSTDQLRVRIWAHLKRAKDADNLLKRLLDGIEEGTGWSDSRYLPEIVAMHAGSKRPFIEIEVSDSEAHICTECGG